MVQKMHTSEFVSSVKYCGKFMAFWRKLMLQLDVLSFEIFNSLVSDIYLLLIYCNLCPFVWKFRNFLHISELGSDVSEVKWYLWLTLSSKRYVIGIHCVRLLAWIWQLMSEFFTLNFQSFNLLQTFFIHLPETDTALKHEFTDIVFVVINIFLTFFGHSSVIFIILILCLQNSIASNPLLFFQGV